MRKRMGKIIPRMRNNRQPARASMASMKTQLSLALVGLACCTAIAAEPTKPHHPNYTRAVGILDGNQDSEQAKQALDLLKAAADAGDMPSKKALARLLHLGTKGLNRDIPASVPYIKELAALNDPWSQNALGVIYENGQGVEPSQATAIHWYREAAIRNNPLAMANLGRLMRAALPSRGDQVTAFAWLRLASDRKEVSAINALRGISAGLPDDFIEAVIDRSRELEKLLIANADEPRK